MKTIDLNCDLGESFGVYEIGMDSSMLPLVSSVNIACGFHAGDPSVMQKTVALANRHGVAIGAHPGYPDLAGFGRRDVCMSPDDVVSSILYQVGALSGFCKAAGAPLRHVKPHGALYNAAAKDIALARSIAGAVFSLDSSLMLVGPPNSRLSDAAREFGIRFVREFFADRGYEDDLSLVSRNKPGSMITDPAVAVARVVELVSTGTVATVSGRRVPFEADTICLHGDTGQSVSFAEQLLAALRQNGIVIKSCA